MADRQLSDILSSGEVLEIKIAGSDAESVVLTKAQVDALFGDLEVLGARIRNVNNPSGSYLELDEIEDITLSFNSASSPRIKLSRLNEYVYIIAGGDYPASIVMENDSIELTNLSIAEIEAAAVSSAVTKEFCEAKYIHDAPLDGNTYGRKDGAWVIIP